MRILEVLAIIAAIASGGCHGCTDDAPVCVHDSRRACFCPTGGPGEQTCNASGLDYGVCTCTPDAGIDAP